MLTHFQLPETLEFCILKKEKMFTLLTSELIIRFIERGRGAYFCPKCQK